MSEFLINPEELHCLPGIKIEKCTKCGAARRIVAYDHMEKADGKDRMHACFCQPCLDETIAELVHWREKFPTMTVVRVQER